MSQTVTLLKKIEANAIVLVMKLHNYHWNVKGMDFHPVHEATEGMYNNFFGLYDDIAERILQLGEKPIVTLKDALAQATIAEESATTFTSKQIAEALLKDFQIFEKDFKDLSDAASGDSVTVALADEQLAAIQKAIWMLKAQLG